MTTLYVTYAGQAGTPFDRRYWIDVHLPLVRACWGPHGLERVGGFFPDGDGAGLIAVCACVFRDEAAMRSALVSPDTPRVMADVARFTDVKPTQSVGRAVAD